MLATFCAEIIAEICAQNQGNAISEDPKFSGGACPLTPLVKSASGARLSIGQAIYIRNPSMQKGWPPTHLCVGCESTQVLFRNTEFSDWLTRVSKVSPQTTTTTQVQ